MRTPLGSRIAAAIITALAVVTAACGADGTLRSDASPSAEPAVAAGEDRVAKPEGTVRPEVPQIPVRPASAHDGNEIVNVYWGWMIDTVPTGSPERLGAGGRVVGAGPLPELAMVALLDGPNAVETEIGMITSIPAGTRLLGVEVSGDVATVDLSDDFNEGGGTLGETMRFAEVVFTLTQFDDVGAVSFRIDGVDVDTVGTHGFDVAAPIDRNTFDDSVRPFILLEHPYPGGEFASGDRIVGDSNTFEATVEYAVVDGDGRILGEGFTTASTGSGTWGRFDATVEFDAGAGGRGGIVVFERSPEDGSPTNVVEYPLNLLAGAPVDELPPTR